MTVLTCTLILACTAIVYFAAGAYMFSKVSRMLQEFKDLKMRDSLHYRTREKGRGRNAQHLQG